MCIVVRNPVISVSEETGRKYYQEVRKKTIHMHLLLFYYCCFTIRGSPWNLRIGEPFKPPKGLFRTSSYL